MRIISIDRAETCQPRGEAAYVAQIRDLNLKGAAEHLEPQALSEARDGANLTDAFHCNAVVSAPLLLYMAV